MAKTLRIEKTAMAMMSIVNIFLRPMASVRYPPKMVPKKIPTMTDAPIAALSAAVRLNIGTIWVKATPIRERTYPSKNEPPLEKKDILRRKGVMATSSIVFFATFLADEGMSFTLAAILCARSAV